MKMLKSNGLRTEASRTPAKTFFHWFKELFILQGWCIRKMLLRKNSF